MKEDQEVAISSLLRTSREYEKMLSEKDVVSKELVICQMMKNWDVKKENDKQIAGECHHSTAGHYRFSVAQGGPK